VIAPRQQNDVIAPAAMSPATVIGNLAFVIAPALIFAAVMALRCDFNRRAGVGH
jgi:hypothetical protein